MKYPVSWQDFLCRWNIWHRYTDWQSDTYSHSDWGYTPVQTRFCFNCHWKRVRRVKFPRNTIVMKLGKTYTMGKKGPVEK